ncbi:hypothetical protein L1049_018306 [Liquidambar formosana]|uniref:Uncharacterized protein n=1 Tax=Liquidambar formosana TaxID=63359 RepID=A0AAP0R9Y3_LIQFO
MSNLHWRHLRLIFLLSYLLYFALSFMYESLCFCLFCDNICLCISHSGGYITTCISDPKYHLDLPPVGNIALFKRLVITPLQDFLCSSLHLLNLLIELGSLYYQVQCNQNQPN